MAASSKTISPVDSSVYVERALASEKELDAILDRADGARVAWRKRVRDGDRNRVRRRGQAVDALRRAPHPVRGV